MTVTAWTLMTVKLQMSTCNGDGNCVFSAIAHMLQTRMHWCTATKNHLLAAGIPEPRADQLRYMFVDDFLERKRDYENQLGQTFKRGDIEIYLQDGMYNTKCRRFCSSCTSQYIKITNNCWNSI